MKKLFLAMPLMALTFLVSCGGSPPPRPAQQAPPRQPTFDVRATVPDRTVAVNFTVSDSVAFSFAQVWIGQNFMWHNANTGEERDPLTFSDPASGVLSGQDMFFSSSTSRGVQFRIFINNGTATLALTGVSLWNWSVRASSQDEAQNAAQRQADNWVERLENTFRAAFL